MSWPGPHRHRADVTIGVGTATAHSYVTGSTREIYVWVKPTKMLTAICVRVVVRAQRAGEAKRSRTR